MARHRQREQRVLRDAVGAAVRPVLVLVICMRVAASGSAGPHTNNSGDDSEGTEVAAGSSNDGSRVAQGASVFGQGTAKRQQRPQTHQREAQRAEDVGSQDVFIAGMIYTRSAGDYFRARRTHLVCLALRRRNGARESGGN